MEKIMRDNHFQQSLLNNLQTAVNVQQKIQAVFFVGTAATGFRLVFRGVHLN